MKPNFLTVIFILFGLSAQSQTINTWLGGHPGQESDWLTAANWSLGEVPDATHNVVIPNGSISPILIGKTIEINSLQMQPGAELMLKDDAHIVLPTSVLFAQATIYWDTKLGRFSAIADYAKR